MPVPSKNRAPQPATPVVSPVQGPRTRAGKDGAGPRTPGSAMEPGPSAVVQARGVAGNAAVSAALGGSRPGAQSRWNGQMMLAGQDLIGNQAVVARAGTLPTARQPVPAQQRPAGEPAPARKTKPGEKADPGKKSEPGKTSTQPDAKGTGDRPDKGARKKDTAGTSVARVDAGPRRLSLPSFARRFDVRATLPPVRANAGDQAALATA